MKRCISEDKMYYIGAIYFFSRGGILNQITSIHLFLNNILYNILINTNQIIYIYIYYDLVIYIILKHI